MIKISLSFSHSLSHSLCIQASHPETSYPQPLFKVSLLHILLFGSTLIMCTRISYLLSTHSFASYFALPLPTLGRNFCFLNNIQNRISPIREMTLKPTTITSLKIIFLAYPYHKLSIYN